MRRILIGNSSPPTLAWIFLTCHWRNSFNFWKNPKIDRTLPHRSSKSMLGLKKQQEKILVLEKSRLEQNDRDKILSAQLKVSLETQKLVATLFNKLQVWGSADQLNLKDFLIYSPENSSLRLQKEGQIEPLGVNGEGLLRLISVLRSDEKHREVFDEIRRSLKLLSWFEDMDLIEEAGGLPSRFAIKDRYLDESKQNFDQMSANEGFLFLVFYFALFSSDLTPRFFAIDNIDASLNPKLCSALMKQLVVLAKKYDKQVILTTHNPAILDGLNLDDDEQRLFVVSRNRKGYTRLSNIGKPSQESNVIKLSEAFLRGSLGGLPKSF